MDGFRKMKELAIDELLIALSAFDKMDQTTVEITVLKHHWPFKTRKTGLGKHLMY